MADLKIRTITVRNVEETSTHAEELRITYSKCKDFIDIWWGSISLWKGLSAFVAIFGIVSVSMTFNTSRFVSLLLLIVWMGCSYSLAKKVWYREWVYDGFDTGTHDATEEFLRMDWATNVVIKNRKRKNRSSA